MEIVYSIYRSTDGGTSWSPLWTLSYPPPDWQMTMERYYDYVTPDLPWMAEHLQGSVAVGSWIHGLAINPFDSNHWLYGTGLSVFGGHDLTNWDASSRGNISLGPLGHGIDETAVLGLTAPIGGGAKLVTAVGDVGGFVHTDTTSDAKPFTNPNWPGVS
jgi:xyloglucan-specific exo-beta-1,4-glucanase